MTQDISSFVTKFGEQIRKGFIRALTLLVLQDQPYHGYEIIKQIDERTDGLWRPVASTMYPLLDKLTNFGLIKIREEMKTGRKKKIYEITKDGEKALKNLIEKFKDLVRSMRSIIVSAFGFDGSYIFEDFVTLIPDDPIFGWSGGKSDNEKRENLKSVRALIDERIKEENKMLNYLDEALLKLKKK